MTRKFTASKSQLRPDPRFGSKLASKFINCLMHDGKKSVPMQVNKVRQQTLSIRWLLMAAREKKGRPMAIKLADELIAAYNRDGAAISRRENVHRMADANKAFAHFAW